MKQDGLSPKKFLLSMNKILVVYEFNTTNHLDSRVKTRMGEVMRNYLIGEHKNSLHSESSRTKVEEIFQ